ncbi:hypothetical protein AAMO2058_000405500 [Amorphochlora amoebiformis]
MWFHPNSSFRAQKPGYGPMSHFKVQPSVMTTPSPSNEASEPDRLQVEAYSMLPDDDLRRLVDYFFTFARMHPACKRKMARKLVKALGLGTRSKVGRGLVKCLMASKAGCDKERRMSQFISFVSFALLDRPIRL